MKSSKDIINSLIKKHSLSSLSKYMCYREFLKVLPPQIQQMIASISLKNSQLLITVKHPGYKMELNYNKEVIKSLLSDFLNNYRECEFMKDIKSVAVFHSKVFPMESDDEVTTPYFSEKADGRFEIDVSDKR